jgi:hypothetical protein
MLKQDEVPSYDNAIVADWNDQDIEQDWGFRKSKKAKMNLIDDRDIEIQIVVSYNLVCWFLKGQEWGPEWDPEWGPDWGPERDPEWGPEGEVHVLSTPLF